jgi:hypothetical protein
LPKLKTVPAHVRREIALLRDEYEMAVKGRRTAAANRASKKLLEKHNINVKGDNEGDDEGSADFFGKEKRICKMWIFYRNGNKFYRVAPEKRRNATVAIASVMMSKEMGRV